MNMILKRNNALLLVIDIQEKLLRAVFNKDVVEKNYRILTKAASILNIPVYVTEQYPKGLGRTIDGILNSAKIFEKTNFNALSDERLLAELKDTGKRQIVVLGIETHICVHQTVCALIENGFEVVVVKDACGSRVEYEYLSGLSVMEHNGASIKSTEMILFEFLEGAQHPNFKEIQTLIK